MSSPWHMKLRAVQLLSIPRRLSQDSEGTLPLRFKWFPGSSVMILLLTVQAWVSSQNGPLDSVSLNSRVFTFYAVSPMHFVFEAGNYFYLIHYLSSYQEWLFHETKYQNFCLLPNLNLISFSFEPFFHCFLLAPICGICFPVMTATYLFNSAKIDLKSLKTFTVTRVFEYSVFASLPSPLFFSYPFRNTQNSLNLPVGLLLILQLEEKGIVCHFYFTIPLNITGLC